MSALRTASDMRLVRILNGLDRRVGPRTRLLREAVLLEMGRRVAAVYSRNERLNRLQAGVRRMFK